MSMSNVYVPLVLASGSTECAVLKATITAIAILRDGAADAFGHSLRVSAFDSCDGNSDAPTRFGVCSAMFSNPVKNSSLEGMLPINLDMEAS